MGVIAHPGWQMKTSHRHWWTPRVPWCRSGGMGSVKRRAGRCVAAVWEPASPSWSESCVHACPPCARGPCGRCRRLAERVLTGG